MRAHHCMIWVLLKKSPWLNEALPVQATYWSTPTVCCQLSTMTRMTCAGNMRAQHGYESIQQDH
jgi:hypothetical protein